MALALGDAMAAAIALRDDFTAQDLRRLARRTRDAGHARRLLALAGIYDGGTRGDAARIGDVGLQPFATGRCGSMPRDRMGSSTGKLQASHRS